MNSLRDHIKIMVKRVATMPPWKKDVMRVINKDHKKIRIY